MDGEIDLRTADRDVLVGIIIRQQAIIEQLEKRIAQSEGQAKSRGSGRMLGLKSKTDRKSGQPKKPRKRRPQGFARVKAAPTQRVEHTGVGCSVPREVIDLPQVPAQVTEHVYIARTCPDCGRRCMPSAELDGVVLGQQRLGINLISLIATLREEGRLPVRAIQWYLRTVHQLRLSVGATVSALYRTAQKAQDAVDQILAQIRASPVVHADETGWRENGHNGYVWTFSTPTERYFLRRDRSKTVVDEVLDRASGVLVSDFCSAYHHYDGPIQRCWAHLLRDIHDLQALYPDDRTLTRWAGAVQGLYHHATTLARHQHSTRRRAAQLDLERRLLNICQPFLDDPSAAQSKLCRRIQRHIKELFILVAEPEVPPDNNAAERSLRHLVVSRKISGGTRSQQGTHSKMTLASLFGSWRAQGLDTLTACKQLLASPQV